MTAIDQKDAEALERGLRGLISMLLEEHKQDQELQEKAEKQQQMQGEG